MACPGKWKHGLNLRSRGGLIWTHTQVSMGWCWFPFEMGWFCLRWPGSPISLEMDRLSSKWLASLLSLEIGWAPLQGHKLALDRDLVLLYRLGTQPIPGLWIRYCYAASKMKQRDTGLFFVIFVAHLKAVPRCIKWVPCLHRFFAFTVAPDPHNSAVKFAGECFKT